MLPHLMLQCLLLLCFHLKELQHRTAFHVLLRGSQTPYWREVYKESLENICKELGIKYVDLNYSTEEILFQFIYLWQFS